MSFRSAEALVILAPTCAIREVANLGFDLVGFRSDQDFAFNAGTGRDLKGRTLGQPNADALFAEVSQRIALPLQHDIGLIHVGQGQGQGSGFTFVLHKGSLPYRVLYPLRLSRCIIKGGRLYTPSEPG